MHRLCRLLIRKPRNKIPLERLRRRREDNIKMYYNEVGFIWLSTGTGKHGNEPSDSIKDRDYFDNIKNYQFLSMGSAPWS
jgi:hypothetical protein